MEDGVSMAAVNGYRDLQAARTLHCDSTIESGTSAKDEQPQEGYLY